MPSPAAEAETAAAAVAAENDNAMFGDGVMEEDDDDSEEEDDDDESEEEFEEDAAPMAVAEDDLNSSPSSSTDDDAPNPANAGNPDPPRQQLPPAPSAPSSQNGAAPQATPVSVAVTTVATEGFETPDPKRQKIDGSAVVASEERKSSASALEDSRRLFQRLWTDEDEIAILQGFYEFTSQRGTTHHAHQHDTGPFYDQIKTKLQLDFNKNQLVEKLRRLKKKYRNVINRMGSGKEFVFKSPHDQATFEISRKIWSNSVTRGAYDHDDDDPNDGDHSFDKKTQRIRKRGRKRSVALAAATETTEPGSEAVAVEVKSVPTLTAAPSTIPVTPTPSAVAPNVVEETVKSCLSPLFKELLQCAISGPLTPPGLGGGAPMALSSMPLSFMGNTGNLHGPSGAKDAAVDQKWRKQQILELEVYSKRLELVQEQIKATMEELRSSGS